MNATLSLHPDRKASAMVSQTLTAPRTAFAAGSLLDRIGARIGKGVRAMQYARLLQAMFELTDEQLAATGLTRTDIPRHARECVYGPQT